MIVSHRHKFIFLKTNKTAGTSVEIALSKFCGPDDIITPISADDEQKRQALGYRGAQNCDIPLSHCNARLALKWLFRKEKRKFYNHISGKDVKALVGDDVWNSYYKFCIERNPWDRFISLYYWYSRKRKQPSIAEFIASRKPLMLKKKGIGLYKIDGEIAVDKICKFENLDADMAEVSQRIGFSEPLSLPQTKAGTRKDKRHYRDILNENDKVQIARLFDEEIKLMGYEW